VAQMFSTLLNTLFIFALFLSIKSRNIFSTETEEILYFG